MSQPTQGAASRRSFIFVYIALMLSMFLGALDQTIVSTALPTIVGELGNVEAMAWIITAYTLSLTVAMPVYGKLSDVIGSRHLFIIAQSIFVISSMLCGFSQSTLQLAIFRFMQGLGGGGLMILSQTIIAELVPVKDRAKFMAPMGMMFAVAAIVGPLLGGILLDLASWPFVFWINAPLGILTVIIAWLYLHVPTRSGRFSFDIPGFVVLSISVGAMTLLFDWLSAGTSLMATKSLIALAIIIVGVISFFLIERRSKDPIIPLNLFTNWTFIHATLLAIASAALLLPTMSFLPTYLQMVYGMSPTLSGYAMLPFVVGMLITAMTSANMISRSGHYRWLFVAGMLVAALSCFLFSQMRLGTPVYWLMGSLFVLGFGVGTVMQNAVLVAQASAPQGQVGTATSSNNLIREIGATIAIAVFGGLFGTWLAQNLIAIGPDLAAALPNVDLGDGSTPVSLTPDMISGLSGELRESLSSAYATALPPVFLYFIPIPLLAALVAAITPERPLRHEEDATSSVTDAEGA